MNLSFPEAPETPSPLYRELSVELRYKNTSFFATYRYGPEGSAGWYIKSNDGGEHENAHRECLDVLEHIKTMLENGYRSANN